MNIFDFLECKRQGLAMEPIFGKRKQLWRYSQANKKICPRSRAKKSQVLCLLLKELF